MFYSVILLVRDPAISRFALIAVGFLLFAIVVGSVVGMIINRKNPKTKFDEQISQPSLSSVVSGVVSGPTGKAGGINANNVTGYLSVEGRRTKHCQAVAGVFAHIFQKFNCFNRQTVNASRKTIVSNFMTVKSTTDAMAFMQRLLGHAPVNTDAYLQMAADVCNDKQRSVLANSICSVFGRKLNAEEWKIIADVLDAIKVSADEKAALQQRYSTVATD
ncbi:MAG: hypothetical protein MJZ23_00725 [Paludibacteraceae bacterium]|nr:hypothetical protein [Paludibacteraceae bacterium]